MAANLTTTYASQILDLLGLSKFKGGAMPPCPPPDKNIPAHSRTLETERHTYQIPSKLRPRVMVVIDQNGARPPENVNCNWLEVLSHADLQQLGPTRERCYCG